LRLTVRFRRGTEVKVAVTFLRAVTFTVHVVVVDLSQPVKPAKTEPAGALAVRTTVVPPGYSSVQSAPQLIPVGELVTLATPAAEPILATFSGCGGFRLNVAVTFRAELALTVHVVAVVLSHPSQLARLEFAAGAAVSVTDIPSA